MNATAIYNPTTTDGAVTVGGSLPRRPAFESRRWQRSVKVRRRAIAVFAVVTTIVGGALLLYGIVFYADLRRQAEMTGGISDVSSSPDVDPERRREIHQEMALYATFLGVATPLCIVSSVLWGWYCWHNRRCCCDRSDALRQFQQLPATSASHMQSLEAGNLQTNLTRSDINGDDMTESDPMVTASAG